MSSLLTVTHTENSVKVDVTDEGARKAHVSGMSGQVHYARRIVGQMGFDTEAEPLARYGKRGVSNRGFTVVLWKVGRFND